MNVKEDVVEELNQLLKGTHMGIFIYEDLQDKIADHVLKLEFHRILKILKEHEEMLSKHIKLIGGNPVDTAGIMGTMSEMMSMVKNLVIISDVEVIEEATKSIEMGMKALRDFDDKHLILNNEMHKEIEVMKDDYSCIYHSLHKSLISYK